MPKQTPFATRKDIDRNLRSGVKSQKDFAKVMEDRLWEEWNESVRETKRSMETARKGT